MSTERVNIEQIWAQFEATTSRQLEIATEAVAHCSNVSDVYVYMTQASDWSATNTFFRADGELHTAHSLTKKMARQTASEITAPVDADLQSARTQSARMQSTAAQSAEVADKSVIVDNDASLNEAAHVEWRRLIRSYRANTAIPCPIEILVHLDMRSQKMNVDFAYPEDDFFEPTEPLTFDRWWQEVGTKVS